MNRQEFESAAMAHKVEGLGFNLEKIAGGAYKCNETRMLFEGWKLREVIADDNQRLREALESAQMALLGYTYHNEITRAALSKASAALAAPPYANHYHNVGQMKKSNGLAQQVIKAQKAIEGWPDSLKPELRLENSESFTAPSGMTLELARDALVLPARKGWQRPFQPTDFELDHDHALDEVARLNPPSPTHPSGCVAVPRELLVRYLRGIGAHAWVENTDEQLIYLLAQQGEEQP